MIAPEEVVITVAAVAEEAGTEEIGEKEGREAVIAVLNVTIEIRNLLLIVSNGGEEVIAPVAQVVLAAQAVPDRGPALVLVADSFL